MSLLEKNDVLIPGRYDFITRLCFLELLTLFYIACIEQENKVDDKFNEDGSNFLMSDF